MKRETITLAWGGKCAPAADSIFQRGLEPAVPVAAVRVPRRAAVPAPLAGQWLRPEPLDMCLDLWKIWMAGDADRDLGIKTTRFLNGGDGHSVDLYEAQQASDTRIAEATDAMIDSMSRIHAWAIYRLSGQATAWTFPNASLSEVGQEARGELRKLLKKNVCTGVFF
ncbi:hypothetical protein [Janthinobacterium agaricidamnosum]|uniref:Uncharacterized protein n=1 Tax=Janthinobacterium agaricidamnosum NBRC 102515 = DSM 9628 TaxID=1349767 RepID=W0V6V1_9BURK|nr:hypothetical protein [Janthinobacterium agaricidamnosum]CDG84554.1 hypothetical protein GJA_3943 [Janthinobacterium agaricidamnosum NBRC 102515 = DSM 9628]